VTADFRIHSICVVKNEQDVIEHCLKEARAWSDFIYVLDNGSTDGTWEKVQAMADERLVAWKSSDEPFRGSLRSDVFNAFRGRSRPGDWWCRLDADEFYIDDPRRFLARVTFPYHVVWGVGVDYFVTDRDLEDLDFSDPVAELLPRLHYYWANSSEARFFRDRSRLEWPADGSWPRHMGLSWPERILFRHYKYRSPAQIQIRLDTRRQEVARGYPGWKYAIHDDWREKIRAAASLNDDRSSDEFVLDTASLPDHLEPPHRRAAKWLLHTLRIWP